MLEKIPNEQELKNLLGESLFEVWTKHLRRSLRV